MSLATRYEDSRRKLKLELNCVKFQPRVEERTRNNRETTRWSFVPPFRPRIVPVFERKTRLWRPNWRLILLAERGFLFKARCRKLYVKKRKRKQKKLSPRVYEDTLVEVALYFNYKQRNYNRTLSKLRTRWINISTNSREPRNYTIKNENWREVSFNNSNCKFNFNLLTLLFSPSFSPRSRDELKLKSFP